MRCVDGRARVPGARTNSGCRSPNRRHRARRAGAGRRRRARDRDIARREYQPDGVERERAVLAGGSDAGLYTLRVSASGFQVQDVTVDLTTEMMQTVEVRLKPAGYAEQLVVTATRSEQRITNVPASINIVTNEQIEQSPAVVADDVLRQVPTFSLFRRTSSIAANPTAQGVSLRGIGPSGVSRTLVLLDDVPFNDPFGGWVYWTRVPMMNAERIEIIDGATSSLYGNYAMGGVINIVTNRPTPRTLIFKPQYGNRSTPKMDLFASDVWGKFGVTFDATSLQTDGYTIVAEEERGAIDNEANVGYQSFSAQNRLQPDRSRQPVRPRRACSTRSGTTARSARSTTRTGSSATAARGCGSPKAATSRRACSSTTRISSRTPLPCRPRRRRAARATCRSRRPCRPTPSDRWCSGRVRSSSARARTSCRREPTSGGSTATATSSPTRSRQG